MKTDTPWLHRYAILIALFALISIIPGAIVTGLERPIAVTPTVVTPGTISLEIWHHAIGAIAAMLMIGMAAWLQLAKPNKPAVQAGWIAAAVGFVEGILGIKPVLHSLPPLTDILHALLGPIFFSSIVAVALMTSESWKQGPNRIEDSWRPSMRSLAIAVPAILLLQITLGAAYRYRALGVIWHILNAMLVLLLILIVAVFLIRQFPEHPTLRPAALAVAIITSIQVLLGFTTFLMLILFPETSLAVLITSVLHVVNGSLTLAAGVVLAILIRYNLSAAKG